MYNVSTAAMTTCFIPRIETLTTQSSRTKTQNLRQSAKQSTKSKRQQRKKALDKNFATVDFWASQQQELSLHNWMSNNSIEHSEQDLFDSGVGRLSQNEMDRVSNVLSVTMTEPQLGTCDSRFLQHEMNQDESRVHPYKRHRKHSTDGMRATNNQISDDDIETFSATTNWHPFEAVPFDSNETLDAAHTKLSTAKRSMRRSGAQTEGVWSAILLRKPDSPMYNGVAQAAPLHGGIATSHHHNLGNMSETYHSSAQNEHYDSLPKVGNVPQPRNLKRESGPSGYHEKNLLDAQIEQNTQTFSNTTNTSSSSNLSEKKRETNRQNARKSRLRKKFKMDALIERTTELEQMNQVLRSKLRMNNINVPDVSTIGRVPANLKGGLLPRDTICRVEHSNNSGMKSCQQCESIEKVLNRELVHADFVLVKTMRRIGANFVLLKAKRVDVARPIIYATPGWCKLMDVEDTESILGRDYCDVVQGDGNFQMHDDVIQLDYLSQLLRKESEETDLVCYHQTMSGRNIKVRLFVAALYNIDGDHVHHLIVANC